MLHNHMKQEDKITQEKVTAPAAAVKQATSSYLGSDWEFLNIQGSAGAGCKIQVIDQQLLL